MVAAVDEAAWLQLRQAALTTRASVQTIVCAGLDLWFREQELPPIASNGAAQ